MDAKRPDLRPADSPHTALRSILKACVSFSLSLVARSEHVSDLVRNHALYSVSGRPEILARIKYFRIFNEELPDLCCHRKTDVCVDVDLADSVLYSFSDHVLRHALSSGNIAAVFVALVDEFRAYC